jgi:hypothetical protein
LDVKIIEQLLARLVGEIGIGTLVVEIKSGMESNKSRIKSQGDWEWPVSSAWYLSSTKMEVWWVALAGIGWPQRDSTNRRAGVGQNLNRWGHM